jgi:hypothetical protein
LQFSGLGIHSSYLGIEVEELNLIAYPVSQILHPLNLVEAIQNGILIQLATA